MNLCCSPAGQCDCPARPNGTPCDSSTIYQTLHLVPISHPTCCLHPSPTCSNHILPHLKFAPFHLRVKDRSNPSPFPIHLHRPSSPRTPVHTGNSSPIYIPQCSPSPRNFTSSTPFSTAQPHPYIHHNNHAMTALSIPYKHPWTPFIYDKSSPTITVRTKKGGQVREYDLHVSVLRHRSGYFKDKSDSPTLYFSLSPTDTYRTHRRKPKRPDHPSFQPPRIRSLHHMAAPRRLHPPQLDTSNAATSMPDIHPGKAFGSRGVPKCGARCVAGKGGG
jgi:hypothetical protein